MQLRELQNQLDKIIAEIGKARSVGDGESLVDLRKRRQELEQELAELSAESAYLEKKDTEARVKAHQDAIEKTMFEYDESEKRYLDALKKVAPTLDRLRNLEETLNAQMENITSLPNPLLILQGIWDELPRDTQREYQNSFEAYRRDVLPKSRIREILDSLSFHQKLLSSATNRLTVKPTESTKKYVGGRVKTSRVPDNKVPFEQKLNKSFENPARCSVRPLVPGSRKLQRVATMIDA